MKKSILFATSAIIATGVAGVSAQAIDVELYGQVNKGVVAANANGDASGADISIVDNDFSSTRFGLRGNQQLSNGLTASVLLEGELEDNTSNAALVDGAVGSPNNTTGGSAWQTRHARVGLGGQWGALFLGRTSTASDGVAEIDLAPAQDVSGSAVDRIGGGIVVEGTNTLSAYADNIDGIGYTGDGNTVGQHESDRRDTVRFDTPIVNGLQGRIAYSEGEDVDAAVLYNNTFAGFEVAGGVSYVSYGDQAAVLAGATDADDAWAITASAKHDSGLSGTINYGERNFDGLAAGVDNPTSYYVKLGYQYNNTGFAIDYARNDDALVVTDATATSSELTSYGAYVQQDLGHGVSASAYYRQIGVERNGVDTAAADVNVVGVNMRVKF